MKKIKNRTIQVNTLDEIGSEILLIVKKLQKEVIRREELHQSLSNTEKISNINEMNILSGKIVSFNYVLDMIDPYMYKDYTLADEVNDFFNKVNELCIDFDVDIPTGIVYINDEYIVQHGSLNLEVEQKYLFKFIQKELKTRFHDKGVTNVRFEYSKKINLMDIEGGNNNE